jgi:hypothetical protein
MRRGCRSTPATTHTPAAFRWTARCGAGGGNSNGQLGTGDYEIRLVPTPVEGAAHWTVVSTGYGHTCGLQVDGSVWCWGLNNGGQLGIGSDAYEVCPTRARWRPGHGGCRWPRATTTPAGSSRTTRCGAGVVAVTGSWVWVTASTTAHRSRWAGTRTGPRLAAVENSPAGSGRRTPCGVGDTTSAASSGWATGPTGMCRPGWWGTSGPRSAPEARTRAPNQSMMGCSAGASVAEANSATGPLRPACPAADRHPQRLDPPERWGRPHLRDPGQPRSAVLGLEPARPARPRLHRPQARAQGRLSRCLGRIVG